MRWMVAALVLGIGCQSPAAREQPPSRATATAAPEPASSSGRAMPTVTARASAAPAVARPAWLAAPPYEPREPVDLVIRGGRVVDGTGGPSAVGAVVVHAGRIVHVGRVGAIRAKKTVDAGGMVVTPGFVDTHSHAAPGGSNAALLAQGVTTACVGQDGRSAGDDRVARLVAKLGRPAVNVAPFVGHGTARYLAGIGLARRVTDKQLARLAEVVRDEMKAGAFGLTTGLEYRPGSLADARELAAAAKPVGAAGGLVMSHLRSEDDALLDAAIDELIAQGRASGARVHVSHIKVVHAKGAARAEALLARLEEARRAGVGVTADIYPYVASYTTIGIVFPDFAKPPADYLAVKRARRDELAALLRDKVTRRGGPEATLFGTEPYRGRTLAAVAERQGVPFEQVLLDIGPRGASAAYFVMDRALQERLLVDPHVMIGSDGSDGTNHPRGRGTFARLIRKHVVEDRRLSLEEAVRKMTGLPAGTVGLAKRGLLRAGFAADILVFAPRQVKDRASYTAPHLASEGMRWVLVNGVAAIADGVPTRQRGGRLLRRR